MDTYAAYGFATPSGYCDAYAKQRTCDVVSQDQSCLGPISSCKLCLYLCGIGMLTWLDVWWNDLHPSCAADLVWARELNVQLSYVSWERLIKFKYVVWLLRVQMLKEKERYSWNSCKCTDTWLALMSNTTDFQIACKSKKNPSEQRKSRIYVKCCPCRR